MPGQPRENEDAFNDERIRPPGRNEGGKKMNTLTSHEMAKLLMAERHQEASRERLAKVARATGSDEEHETSVWRRWALRRLVGRITLAQGA
jgi:hypothetical protein